MSIFNWNLFVERIHRVRERRRYFGNVLIAADHIQGRWKDAAVLLSFYLNNIGDTHTQVLD